MLSKNGVGIVVFFLSFIGVQLTDVQVVDFLSAVGQLISFALLVWNQLDRPDVDNFIFKK